MEGKDMAHTDPHGTADTGLVFRDDQPGILQAADVHGCGGQRDLQKP